MLLYVRYLYFENEHYSAFASCICKSDKNCRMEDLAIIWFLGCKPTIMSPIALQKVYI